MFKSQAAQALIQQNPCSTYQCEVDKVLKTVKFEYRYGTSGFRGDASILNSVFVRVGLLATLRSFYKNGEAIGLMITASHNPENDNGVKIIDPTGEMLCHTWESIATNVANLPPKDVLHYLEEMYEELPHKNIRPTIFVGRDTRPHSNRFSKLLIRACYSVACDVIVKDFGEITTPQLHYLVRYANLHQIGASIENRVYLENTVQAWLKCLQLLGKGNTQLNGELVVDCANGVGGLVLQQLCTQLDDILPMHLVHMPSPEWKVNHECGAEHVQKKRQLPQGLQECLALDSQESKNTDNEENKMKMKNNWRKARMASVDGDCDRLIYFYLDAKNQLQILDGDKQLCLLVTCLKKFIDQSNVALTVGVVQTAYANGASTDYLKKVLHLKPVCAKTGVKFLHLEALLYDVSVYFEANGHGTVLIKDTAAEKLEEKFKNSKSTSEEKLAAQMLLYWREISNQAIGDALADLLLIELSLHILQWDVAHWNSIYQDRPSILTAMKVKDRTVFETTNAEQTCVKPVGLQAKIDEIVAKYENGRAFVRPSGTEDVVRIYAEGKNVSHATEMNKLVSRAVYELAGGVGAKP